MVNGNSALSSWEREPFDSLALFYDWPTYDFKIHPESFEGHHYTLGAYSRLGTVI